MVKCPACGRTKRIDHARTRSFNCCGIRLPVEEHMIYEGVKRPIKKFTIADDRSDVFRVDPSELKEIVKKTINEIFEEESKKIKQFTKEIDQYLEARERYRRETGLELP